jgi:DNA-directed RNA polymerase beta' subunit
VIGALYLGPVYQLAKTYRETSVVKEEYHRVVAENQRLQRLAEHARSDSVLRREARRQGMIVIGEQAYVVNGLED